MKRKFLIVLLSIVCALCLALGISACSSGSGTDSTLVMEEGIVYFTDFSIKYTSAADSPNGDIDESTLTDEIDGSVQSYYLVMDFNMQLASNTDGREYITVKFVVLDANVVETIVNYADTSNVSAITSDGQTTITATYSLPDKAKSVKNINLVLELKPKSTGETGIYYYFSSDTKQIGSYTDEDITYNYTSSNISTSKTSLRCRLNSDGKSYSVTGIGTQSGDVKFYKETYNGLPVTSIGNYAFSGCTTLTSITIPYNITSIGDRAFSGCTALTSITIPNSVTSIGDRVFYKCTSLTGITIPNSVTSIGDRAFEDCTALTSIIIPNSVTSIGGYTFLRCTSLTSITIPNSVTSIGDYAIQSCTALKSITIPDSVISIGRGAFMECTALTSIIIPDSVTSIGGSAFYVCHSLTSITISDSVTSIGDSAFEECTALKSIRIPDSVTSIGWGTFLYCTSLTSVTIGSGVTSISYSAFRSCTALTSITIGSGVTSIAYGAFEGCSKLTSVTFENTSGWYVTQNKEAESGTDITSDALLDTSTAATYLKSTYYDYFWYRK